MDLFLREKVLETQICSVCKQYLSHEPIKVYLEEGIKCGRCNKKTDEGTISFINKIVKNFIFPCVNRFEGCSQLLRFQDVPDHEKSCLGALFQCPLCPLDKYVPNSLLYLVNHYKIFHNKYYRTEPSFFIDVNSPEETFFLYCDRSENILIIIFVQFNGSKLCISASTVGTRVDNLKYRVKLYENGSKRYESMVHSCPAIGTHFDCIEINRDLILQTSSASFCVLEHYTLEAFDIALPLRKFEDHMQESVSHKLNDQTKKCKSVVVNNQPNKKKFPQDYRKYLNIDPSFVKKMPDIYLTEDFQSTFGNIRKKQHFDIIGEYSVLVDRLDCITNTLCKFCENYYATSGEYQEIYICGHTTICGSCYNKGAICKYCRSLFKSPTPKHYKLLYYCRFGCKQFFKGGQLSIHERYCLWNPEATLSDSDFAKQYFGEYFVETSVGSRTVVVRSNVVVFDKNLFGDKGKIYVVTDYKFQCIIIYETNYETRRINFRSLHRYFSDKCYILFKIVNKIYFEEPNSFYINYSEADRVLFVAVVRKL